MIHIYIRVQTRSSLVVRVLVPLHPGLDDGFMLYGGNSEALGWALDAIARAVTFVGPAVYLSVAIINLAKNRAGCPIGNYENEDESENVIKDVECYGKVYGLRPSSLLTTLSTVVALISAFSLPFVGAVVDYTSHRKFIGFVTAVAQIMFTASQIFVNERNWGIIMILLVFNAFIGWVHTLTAFAYLPELTEDPKLLVDWTANFHILQYFAIILFLVCMLGILNTIGFDGSANLNDDILSARVASTSTLVITTPLFMYSWIWLMKKRDAFHTLPQGSSLATIGFVKVFQTSKLLYRRHRAIMWFFVNVALVEASQQSIATIGLTYMTDTLQMTPRESGFAILMLFVFSAVGACLGKISLLASSSSSSASSPWSSLNLNLNPIRSNQLCQMFTAGNTALAALIVYKPNQQLRAYIVAAGWGIGAGWKNVVERFTICQIIPQGQDAELMGFYLFASQVIGWTPTLIFTAMNEAGIDQRIGLSMLIVFFLGGMFALWMMGSYDAVVQIANRREEDRSTNNGNDDNVSEDADGVGDGDSHECTSAR